MTERTRRLSKANSESDIDSETIETTPPYESGRLKQLLPDVSQHEVVVTAGLSSKMAAYEVNRRRDSFKKKNYAEESSSFDNSLSTSLSFLKVDNGPAASQHELHVTGGMPAKLAALEVTRRRESFTKAHISNTEPKSTAKTSSVLEMSGAIASVLPRRAGKKSNRKTQPNLTADKGPQNRDFLSLATRARS